MARPIQLTGEQKRYLQVSYGQTTLVEMARNIGVCTDSLKRVLVREGIAQFTGAKFEQPRGHIEATWQRPCSNCGDTSPRPKWIFFCKKCQRLQALGLLN